MNTVVYDIETYPNVFTVTLKKFRERGGLLFECSDRRNDIPALIKYLDTVTCMIGFNNFHFDWPIIDRIRQYPEMAPADIYLLAKNIIDTDSRKYTIWQPDIEQVDLYLIHHFNNKAKSTSLKKLEFNMRSTSVQNLPFSVGEVLSNDEIDILLRYNVHDVLETEKFAEHSLEAIDMRRAIEPKWINQSDTGLGRKYFERALERAGVTCRTPDGPMTTERPDGVRLSDAIFSYLNFRTSEISQALEYYKSSTVVEVTEKNGKISHKLMMNEAPDEDSLEENHGSYTFELSGITITMGLGGIHASMDRKLCVADEEFDIVDYDITSFYPNLAIKNRIFPEHLGVKFCDVFAELLNERLKHAKGSPINVALKRALTSVFGSSGSRYTCFYDPKYMWATTINGQFLILSMAEFVLNVSDVRIIQINTDGITVRVPKARRAQLDEIIDAWSKATKMPVECTDYRRMWIRDVNNYIAEYADGRRKRKGAYESVRQWHQNHGKLIVPKAAEAAMCDGADIEAFIAKHTDYWDFLCRLDLTKLSHLKVGNKEYRGVVRYYVSSEGEQAVKYMPKTQTKLHAVGHATCSGKRGAWTCDDCGATFSRKADWQTHSSAAHSSFVTVVQEYDGSPIDFDMKFYRSEVEKLIISETC